MKSISANGVVETIEYKGKAASSPRADTLYSVVRTTNLGAWSASFFNLRGEEIQTRVRSGTGQTSVVNKYYGVHGELVKVSEPFLNGTSETYATLYQDHDAKMRPTRITNPAGHESKIVYRARSVQYINEKKQSKFEHYYADGKLKQTVDHAGNVLAFTYDAAGNLTKTEDRSVTPAIVTTIAYDARGQKTLMTDPNKGTWSYQYNGFGELIRQTDAKGQSTCQAYDVLGRMVKRIDRYTGGNANAGNQCANDTGTNRTTLWEYDTAPNGLGQLAPYDGRLSRTVL